jgi:hypothetical protein
MTDFLDSLLGLHSGSLDDYAQPMSPVFTTTPLCGEFSSSFRRQTSRTLLDCIEDLARAPRQEPASRDLDLDAVFTEAGGLLLPPQEYPSGSSQEVTSTQAHDDDHNALHTQLHTSSAVEQSVVKAENDAGMMIATVHEPQPHGVAHRIDNAREKKDSHWKGKLVAIQSRVRVRGLHVCPELQRHMEYSKRHRHQARKQALILFLHLMRADGIIAARSDLAAVQGKWAAFRVEPGMRDEFLRQLQELFGSDGRDMAVNSTARRTIDNGLSAIGYRPNGAMNAPFIWERAYSGTLEFVAKA